MCTYLRQKVIKLELKCAELEQAASEGTQKLHDVSKAITPMKSEIKMQDIYHNRSKSNGASHSTSAIYPQQKRPQNAESGERKLESFMNRGRGSLDEFSSRRTSKVSGGEDYKTRSPERS